MAEQLYQSAFSGAQIDEAVGRHANGEVVLNIAQSLTDKQKAQARTNIGAVSEDDVATAIANAENVFVAVYNETTYEEIVAAVSKGKTCFCLYSVSGPLLALSYPTNSSVTFSGLYNNTVSYSCTCDSSNTWTNSVSSLQSANFKTTTVSSSSTDQQYPTAKAVYTALTDKQDTITGAAGQVVGFDDDGNPVAQDLDTSGGVSSWNDLTDKPFEDKQEVVDAVVSRVAPVSYAEQELTDEQQTQARTNIGAISKDDIPKEVFVATYGTTTSAEVEEAYQAGKIVACDGLVITTGYERVEGSAQRETYATNYPVTVVYGEEDLITGGWIVDSYSQMTISYLSSGQYFVFGAVDFESGEVLDVVYRCTNITTSSGSKIVTFKEYSYQAITTQICLILSHRGSDTQHYFAVCANNSQLVAVCASDVWSYTSVEYQDVSALTASVSSSSTDTEYPSALAVYTAIESAKTEVQEYVDIRVPAWTADDEGKFLQIVNGTPAWVSISNAEEASF